MTFEQFFAVDFQRMIETIPGEMSWDRKAAMLLWADRSTFQPGLMNEWHRFVTSDQVLPLLKAIQPVKVHCVGSGGPITGYAWSPDGPTVWLYS